MLGVGIGDDLSKAVVVYVAHRKDVERYAVNAPETIGVEIIVGRKYVPCFGTIGGTDVVGAENAGRKTGCECNSVEENVARGGCAKVGIANAHDFVDFAIVIKEGYDDIAVGISTAIELQLGIFRELE